MFKLGGALGVCSVFWWVALCNRQGRIWAPPGTGAPGSSRALVLVLWADHHRPEEPTGQGGSRGRACCPTSTGPPTTRTRAASHRPARGDGGSKWQAGDGRRPAAMEVAA
ncbi:unnamed protein product [Amoebophrya sp. A120]|nr:unnamed protein product [Amoebophrya sp. A120]